VVKLEYEILTGILRRFVIYLEDLPANLRLLAHSLLFFLLVIDIAITIYNHIDDENFSYIKWAKSKVLKVGFIIFMINKYEWVLNGVKSFFFDVAGKAIRTNLFSNNEFFENPSELYSKGADLAAYIYEEGVSWYSPSSWGYIILSILIIIGFLMLAVQLIICWIEYYFLTGFSIVFLPFGVLDVGLDYYKSVFKTILSCSIKLAVMNFWLRLSTAILNDLFKLTNKNIKLELVILIFGTLYVIVAIMQFLPSMTSGLLTGTPAVNASAAVAAAKASAWGTVTGAAHVYRGTKEAVKGAWKGGKTGANLGGSGGAFIGSLGGPVGIAAGKIVGGTLGAVGGAAIGGSYAGARYGVFKEKAKKKEDGGNNTSSQTSSSNQTSSAPSGGNAPQSGNGGSNNNGGNSGSLTGHGQTSSSNIQQSSTGNVNSNNQAAVNTSNSTQTITNSSGNTNSSQAVSTSSNTSVNNSNMSNSQVNDTTTSSVSDTSTNTNSVSDNTSATTGTSNSTSPDTVNNIGNSNNTISTANTSSANSDSADTGDGSGKRGIKVNGGEAGKLPDWMQGDY
jgi:uncharacterized transmembrane protein DDB_G0289901